MTKKLFDQFQPQNYQLTLDINEAAKTFSGSVLIRGTAKKGAESISLHSKDLTIKSAKLSGQTAEFELKPNQDELIIKSEEKLPPDPINVEADFEGKITDDMVGIYPCYFEKDDEKKWLIATQFESHYARNAFPCIDEPAAKASFDLTLITDAKYPAISNMESNKQSIEGSRKITTFKPTPRMSTYLLAFVTGDMLHKEAKTKDGVIVRSWASAAQAPELLDYSLDEATKMIEFYNDYFQTPYPLEKCDQVALPDFDAGAMENWGLVTYRETAMLSDPDNPSLSSQQYISLVIAHELSHQWFGNLVTMKWWDDLWLNESFASLMEHIAIDALHPDWEYWEQYASSDMIAASNRDVYSDVQAVRVEVNDPAEISSLFDGAIVYAKGGRLLKMLREYIGETAFRVGLKDYFKKHAYGNTVRDDLWTALSKSSGKDIGKFMNAWLEQSGQPILEVNQTADTIKFSQKRLLLDKPASGKQLWPIPLASSDPKFPLEIVETKDLKLKYTSKKTVFFNNSASGHYVIQYLEPNQKTDRLKAMQNGQMPSVARIMTFNDEILLTKAGESSLVDVLDLVAANHQETRSSVWELMAAGIGNARMLIEGDKSAEDNLRAFTYDLVKESYTKLDWNFKPQTDPNKEHFKRLIISLAVSSKHPAVIDQALEYYQKVNDPVKLPAEYRPLLMGAAVRFGLPSVINQLLDLNRQTVLADLRGDIASALTSTEDTDVIKRLLAILKDGDQVRAQDLIRWYAYLMRNQYSRPLMWKWAKDNWRWLLDTFAQSKSYDYLPRYAANCMNSTDWLEEYCQFFEPKIDDPALTRTIKVGLKEIKARVAWRQRDEAKIVRWLSDRSN